MRVPVGGSWPVPAIAAALMACGAEVPADRAVTVRDSAGARTTVSQDADLVFADLDSLPAVSIGGTHATGPTQFSYVQGVHVDRGGRLWVADGQSGELRIFESNGSHWKTRGGSGEGPGEFTQIRLLGATRGDSVLIGDRAIGRVTLFSPEGEFVRTELLSVFDRPAPLLFDVFSDGSLLGLLPHIVAASSLQPGQVLPDSVELVRVTLESSTIQPYGSSPGTLWIWTGRSQVPVPFTVNASFDVVGDELHLASGPDFRVRVFRGGQLREVYGVARERRPVGEDDLETYRVYVRDYVPIPEPTKVDYLSALDHELRPDVLPGYDRVVVSEDGHVWAQVYEADFMAPHSWDVFDSDRRFAGRVQVWGGFNPMTITRDAMVGVWRDTLGVEHVRAFRFVRR